MPHQNPVHNITAKLVGLPFRQSSSKSWKIRAPTSPSRKEYRHFRCMHLPVAWYLRYRYPANPMVYRALINQFVVKRLLPQAIHSIRVLGFKGLWISRFLALNRIQKQLQEQKGHALNHVEWCQRIPNHGKAWL